MWFTAQENRHKPYIVATTQLVNPGRSFNIPAASKRNSSASSSNSWLWMQRLSVMCQMLRANPPPPLNVNLMLSMTLTCLWMPPVWFISSHFYTQELLLWWLCSFVVVWCDNIGLVSLILLGWELRVLYHCTMCTRHSDLVTLDFYAIPIFHILI